MKNLNEAFVKNSNRINNLSDYELVRLVSTPMFDVTKTISISDQKRIRLLKNFTEDGSFIDEFLFGKGFENKLFTFDIECNECKGIINIPDSSHDVLMRAVFYGLRIECKKCGGNESLTYVNAINKDYFIDVFLNYKNPNYQNILKFNYYVMKDCWDGIQIRYHIIDEIKKMSYSDFLKTAYWKIISKHVKTELNNECALCGCVDNLVSHHRNYSFHGLEIENVDKITVLCSKCHNSFHKHIDHIEV